MGIFAYLAIALILILFHALAAFINCNISKMFGYVNIALHICLFFVLMILKTKLEVLAISFMFSLFVYLFFSYAAYRFSTKRKREEDESV
jgi:hypothetical protein